MEALRVEGLSKDFGGVRAVRQVSFSVEAGEHLAIIGPNGAGKTTLFNLLDGQLSPTAGRVYLFGQEVTNTPAYRRAHLGIARSFQLTTLFLNLTVLENILLAIQGTQPSRFQMFRSATAYENLYTKAKELLDSMDLWEKKDDSVNALSYGEQRKLEISLSLALGPKLLLLDEPSCGLTTAESADITSRIRSLGKNITVILVAHDMDLVFGVAERIIVLHYGEIIAEGTSQQISTDPRVKEIYMGSEEDEGNAQAG
jgi:branched-chain amino acid transport system ATP-binding protein